MTSVAEIINNMENKFNPAAAAGLDLVFQFNIEDDSNFYAVIKDGACNVAQGDAEDPNVTLIMDSETLNGVISGETDGMQAFMGGKLRAEGDMMLALKLGELFPV
ncbi:MAG: SCP2 sterol-binding domain-containing protein [Pseudomonas sp.]